MKGRTIILDHHKGREAAALMVNGVLDDLLIDDDSAPRTGAIFRAICDRPLKGQGGMMLRLPDGDTAFLKRGKGLKPGQPLLVQVTGFADDGKAIPVTDRVLFKSRFAIATPGKPGVNISRAITDDDRRDQLKGLTIDYQDDEIGLILRSSCQQGTNDEIIEDVEAMLDLARAVLADTDGRDPEALTEGDGPHTVAWREWTAPASVETEAGGFDRLGVLDQIDALQDTHILLDGGSMYVEATRALVAVDVNTGNDTSPAAALKANLAAAKALPRALRLRGFGGQIAVDFVSISKAHRRQLEQGIRQAFKDDPIETSLVGWTTMGLFEMQRKRERQPTKGLL